jgi:hypothetical protein
LPLRDQFLTRQNSVQISRFRRDSVIMASKQAKQSDVDTPRRKTRQHAANSSSDDERGKGDAHADAAC